jgi:hypothetical protein
MTPTTSITKSTINHSEPTNPKNRRAKNEALLYPKDESPYSVWFFTAGNNAAAKRLRELGFDVRGPDRPEFAINFEPGKLYNRRPDIHDVYGGQHQGGISTPFLLPFIFLFAGESGGQFGYSDGPQDDGTFSYTGEGQRGDMQFRRGNRAIRDHVEEGKDLLLFESTNQSGMYRFLVSGAAAPP